MLGHEKIDQVDNFIYPTSLTRGSWQVKIVGAMKILEVE